MKRLWDRLLGRGVAPAPIKKVTVDRGHAEQLLAQGHALEDAGQFADAEARYREALRLSPEWARVWLNLGNVQFAQEQIDDAIASYHEALRQDPDYGAVHANLGKLYLGQQHYSEAAAHYAAAARLMPDSVDCVMGLGSALEETGRHDEALDAYRRALILQPDLTRAQLNLGRLLLALGKTSLYYRRYQQTIEYYSEAISIVQDSAEIYVDLGYSLENTGCYTEAERAYRQALAIDPDFLAGKLNLGQFLTKIGQMDEATEHLESFLAVKPDSALGCAYLGSVLSLMGFISDAIGYMRKASDLEPNNPEFANMVVFTTNYLPDYTPKELFDLHLDYAQRFCAAFYPEQPSYSNAPDPERRLKIGYVSGDFRGHPVCRFIEPVFIHHDSAHFEIHAFYNYSLNDEITDCLKELTDGWHVIFNMGDEAVAHLVSELDIDILIDLSGHTVHNRMQIFARKPAPVQAAWLGYLGTTGLSTMDYRIGDVYTDPPGLTERFHTEQLMRMPDSQWCHVSYVNAPPIGELPLRQKGYLTLGSFNNPAKLNNQVLALWAEVLLALPGSHLRIAAAAPGRTQQRIVLILSNAGVAPERIEFMPYTPYHKYLAAIAEVDIALDPFPYNGGTTSIDILMMGVPLVTLAGDHSIARGGVSLLSNIELPELIASSPEEYVAIVQRLANDPDRLVALRYSLRERLQQSPLMDGARFTRHLEQLYRQMWRAWCAKANGGSTGVASR